MRYNILQQALKEIVESHKAEITFVTGLETDINTENVRYPVVFLQPPAFDMPFNDGVVGNDIWSIHLESQEQISDASTTEEKQEALDRTREYLRDIVLEFTYTYGNDGKSVTVDNITEVMDFIVIETTAFVPFVDLGDNITGWMVDFKIQEGDYDTLCHLTDIFN